MATIHFSELTLGTLACGIRLAQSGHHVHIERTRANDDLTAWYERFSAVHPVTLPGAFKDLFIKTGGELPEQFLIEREPSFIYRGHELPHAGIGRWSEVIAQIHGDRIARVWRLHMQAARDEWMRTYRSIYLGEAMPTKRSRFARPNFTRDFYDLRSVINPKEFTDRPQLKCAWQVHAYLYQTFGTFTVDWAALFAELLARANHLNILFDSPGSEYSHREITTVSCGDLTLPLHRSTQFGTGPHFELLHAERIAHQLAL